MISKFTALIIFLAWVSAPSANAGEACGTTDDCTIAGEICVGGQCQPRFADFLSLHRATAKPHHSTPHIPQVDHIDYPDPIPAWGQWEPAEAWASCLATDGTYVWEDKGCVPDLMSFAVQRCQDASAAPRSCRALGCTGLRAAVRWCDHEYGNGSHHHGGGGIAPPPAPGDNDPVVPPGGLCSSSSCICSGGGVATSGGICP